MSILDNTITALEGGIKNLAVKAATENIEGWLGTLQQNSFEGSQAIADNLQKLHTHLEGGNLDGAAIASLMTELAQQTDSAARSVQGDDANKLQKLAGLLSKDAAALK